MQLKRLLIFTAIALVCFAAVVRIELTEPYLYRELRHVFRDAIARAGRTTPPNPDLMFLAIDADSVGLQQEEDLEGLYDIREAGSVEARALTLMTQRWPWPREVYALILDRLVDAGAKVVVLDLTFSASTAEDQLFRAALERHRDRVVIGSNFANPSWNGLARVGASHLRPAETLIPHSMPTDGRVGYTNFWPDDDDTVRQAQYHLAFEQLEGRTPSAESEIFRSLAAVTLRKAGLVNKVPLGLAGLTIRFTGAPGEGFPPRSLFEIFVPEYWKRNYHSGAAFRDKIVLIGAHGSWQHDEHKTPFGTMPGPEIHLNAINAAIHGEFIRELSRTTTLALSGLAALLAVLINRLGRSVWLRPLALVGLNLLAAAAALYAYNTQSTFIPVIAPLSTLNLAVVAGLMVEFGFERREKSKVRRALERYVSRDVVKEMLDRPAAYTSSLGGVIKPVTVLFSDIRAFTKIASTGTPEALVRQLNEYLTAMVDCVFHHGGTLDKFIGDAVMAVWGNVHSDGPTADAGNAISAALAMEEAVVALNKKWRAEGRPELRIGIAVNHGRVVVGNVGSPQRMEFTVIGEVVNVTWRLQELTKQLGHSLIISETVAARVADRFETRSLGRVEIPAVAEMEIFTATRFAPTLAAVSTPQPRPLAATAAELA